ncbi:OmpA family protein [Nitratireductor rhodophyticola]|uniref:OmpA family protein n=1 Tax=Nitratireductor rhodophyticola TaxID=2854036 RepID=UPI003008B1C9
MWKCFVRTVLICSAFLGSAAYAEDLEGAEDHPLLSRFPTATIRAYQVRDFDVAILPAGRIDDGEVPGDLLEVEGKITRIAYRIAGERSALEVMRNYESALAQAGFETVFACESHETCGVDMMAFIANSGTVRPQGFGDAFFGGTAERALLASQESTDGVFHVFLHVVEDTSNNRTLLYQQVVEGVALRTDQVDVLQAGELQRSLERQGHVAVQGVYFDTGKSQLKQESGPALDQIAELLRANSHLQVYVVGHTDNVGDLAANTVLSEARAAAVVARLEADYGIERTRLIARGVASLAPVASNADESGRSRNRRVEIVAQ